MSKVSSDRRRESVKSSDEFSERRNKFSRPGWPEVIVGLAVMAVVAFGGVPLIAQLDLDPVVYGLIVAAWSGIAGILAFAAAVMLRIRSLSVFGVVRPSVRWLLIAAGAGALAIVIRGLISIAYIQIAGDSSTPQTVYAEAAGGGALALILTTLFLGFLTPLGEELLFRGVLTNALLRYGPIIGVVGSALVFALFHGINIILPAAFVAGLFAGEVFRRSGSIWPAVVVHVVFNLPTPLFMVLAGMG